MKRPILLFLLLLVIGCNETKTNPGKETADDIILKIGTPKPQIGATYLCPAELFDMTSPPGGRYIEVELKRAHNGLVLVRHGGSDEWVNFHWLKQPPLTKKEEK